MKQTDFETWAAGYARSSTLSSAALVAALSTPEALAVEAADAAREALRTPLPGARRLEIYALEGRWVVVPTSGFGGFFRWAEGAVATGGDESPEARVAALRSAADRCGREAGDDDVLAAAKKLVFRAAGVRSYRALAAASQLAIVTIDDEKTRDGAGRATALATSPKAPRVRSGTRRPPPP